MKVSATPGSWFFRMTAKITNLRGISGRNFFFYGFTQGFWDRWFRILRFTPHRDVGYPDNRQNTEFIGKWQKKIFFFLFVLFIHNQGFRWYRFGILRLPLLPDYGFSEWPPKYRIYGKFPEESIFLSILFDLIFMFFVK